MYWFSVPNGFNTVRENRRFFDSDGEFITRQFKQGKTYTHQDHLLYHILAKSLYNHAESIPVLPKDPVVIHKIFSVFFGALGITFLFIFGTMVAGRIVPALLLALFVAGSAGYWFFSATIDTYIPCLCFCCIALGATLKCLRDQKISSYIILGAAAGMAFLFRTDGFLLGSLGLVLFVVRKRFLARLLAVVLSGALIGACGYAVLAHHFYNIAIKDVPAWSLGHLDRQETGQNWGVVSNLTAENFRLVTVNQVFYTVFLPGLESTRGSHVRTMMRKLPYGEPVLYVYLLFLIVLIGHSLIIFLKSLKTYQFADALSIILAAIWLFSRTIFYTWWNPYEPFLFAVMSIPSLWLFSLVFLREGKYRYIRVIFVAVIVILLWIHNLYYLIFPLRALATV